VRRLLILVAVLALLAIPAVPAAAVTDDTGVSGSITVASVATTAPDDIAFGPFTNLGYNYADSPNPGTVTVTPGTSGATSWTVTAASDGGYTGRMWSAGLSRLLNDQLLISDTGSPWYNADGSGGNGTLTYTGTANPGSLPLKAAQNIVQADIDAGVGSYSIVIVFTATCLP
jgi:hypothetical protein